MAPDAVTGGADREEATRVRPGEALLLVAASAAAMAGTVFLVNVARYGLPGALFGAVLLLASAGLAGRVFRRGSPATRAGARGDEARPDDPARAAAAPRAGGLPGKPPVPGSRGNE